MTEKLVGNCNWMFGDGPPEELYPLIQKMGFKAVEHTFPYSKPAEETRALLQDHELEPSLIYTPCRYSEGELGFAGVPGREAEYQASVEAAVAYAERIGCRTLGTMAGEIPPGEERQRYLDVLVSNLAQAAKTARSAGMEISLEPITSFRRPLYLLQTMDQAAEVADAVGDASIGLCFDTFHVGMEKGSVCGLFDQYADRINYVQIANPPGRHGVGNGDLDLHYFLDHALGRTRSYWLSCEYIQPREALEAALDFARPYVAQGRLRF